MLYSIKDREDLEKLEELVSLQSQIKAVRLQDKLGKQKYHYELKEITRTNNWCDQKRLWKYNKNYHWILYNKQQSNRGFKQQTFRNNEW